MPALVVVAVVHCASNAKRKKDQQGMFSPGKYEQKDGLPRAWNIFFPLPVWLLRGSGASLGNKRSRQRGEKDGGRRLKQEGREEGCSVAFCILRAGFLRRHDVRFHLGSVRRRANSAHEPTHRRLCIKCPTLCAAAYFFTAFPPYTSLSVILLVVLCRRHF